MFNGEDSPPPYERDPPRDPPPPRPPTYPLSTAPTFRLSNRPIFPVTQMDDPDLTNLNAYRELEYTEFLKPPGRRVEQTHYAIIIGCRLGVTANLKTARATQINVSGGWIEECVSYWQAIWFYRQKYKAGHTSLRFRGNSPSTTAAFDRLTAPASALNTNTEHGPSLSKRPRNFSSNTLQSISRSISTTSTSGSVPVAASSNSASRVSSSRSEHGTSTSARLHHSRFPTLCVPTSELLESANASAPPLIRATLRRETANYSKQVKRSSDGSAKSTSRPKKTPQFTVVIDLTADDDDDELDPMAHNSSKACTSKSASVATNTTTPQPSDSQARQFPISRAISISDSEEEEDIVERALLENKGKGKAD